MFDEEETNSPAGNEDSVLTINKKYAKQYEKRKRREEISNLEESLKNYVESDIKRKKPKLKNDADDEKENINHSEESEASSEEEDDDAALLTPEVENTFLQLLPRLAQRDASIYDHSVHFFPDSQPAIEKNEAKKKEKPFYLRDHLRREVLEQQNDSEEDNDEQKTTEELSYPEQQKKLKEEFLKSLSQFEQDDSDELLVPKKKSKTEILADDEEFNKWLEEKNLKEKIKQEQRQRAADNKTKFANQMEFLKSYWKNPNLDDEEKFLRDYILNCRWKEKQETIPDFETIVNDLDEDENHLDSQDAFEANYNFRFESSNGNADVPTHPRNIESSRKKSTQRSKQRQEKKERKRLEEIKKKEELLRLKKLKREEIQEKLEKIQAISKSKNLPGLSEDLLEQDFDPDTWDTQMNKIFSDQYYQEEEDKKPDFPEEEEEEEEAVSIADRLIRKKKNEKKEQEEKEVEKEQNKSAQKSSEVERVSFDQLMDEYYKLDYEDLIAGEIPCRFKYQTVQPNSYGLKIQDILQLEDSDLNRYVSVKKLAPFRTKEWYPRTKPPRWKPETPKQTKDTTPTFFKKTKKRKHKKRNKTEKEKSVSE